MKKTKRLTELLDQKDAEIEQLEQEVDDLKQKLDSTKSGWSLPREVENEHPDLPVPRLEIRFTPTTWADGEVTWGRTVIAYDLVRTHFLGHLEVTPMGRTVRTTSDTPPWFDGDVPQWVRDEGLDEEAWRIGYALPHRDGAHAKHDSGHLGLPLYVQTQNGMEELPCSEQRCAS